MITAFYLTGTVGPMGQTDAEAIISKKPCTLARQNDDGRFTVYFLTTSPIQSGQVPFRLEPGESFDPIFKDGFWVSPDGVKFTLEQMAKDYIEKVL
jgi:hypothetical protein